MTPIEQALKNLSDAVIDSGTTLIRSIVDELLNPKSYGELEVEIEEKDEGSEKVKNPPEYDYDPPEYNTEGDNTAHYTHHKPSDEKVFWSPNKEETPPNAVDSKLVDPKVLPRFKYPKTNDTVGTFSLHQHALNMFSKTDIAKEIVKCLSSDYDSNHDKIVNQIYTRVGNMWAAQYVKNVSNSFDAANSLKDK